MRGERDDLLNRFRSLPASVQVAATQITEGEKALVAIRQARDAVMTRAAAVSEKLNVAHLKIDELTDDLAIAQRERDTALEQMQTAQSDAAGLREVMQVAQTELSALREETQALQSEVAQLRDQMTAMSPPDVASAMEKELAAAKKELATARSLEENAKVKRKESMANLVEQFAEERQRLVKKYERLKTTTEVQVKALKDQMSAKAKESVSQAEVDGYRLEIAELKSQLDALKEEQRQERQTDRTVSSEAVLPIPVMVLPPERPTIPTDVPVSIPTGPLEPELLAMLKAIEEISQDSTRIDALDVLGSQFQDFGRRALSENRAAVHRVATTCGEIAGWLRKTPKKISSTAKPLIEAVGLMSSLMKVSGDQVGDPAGANVYAVDDDVDNCECMAMALERIGLNTRYAMKAEVALTELVKIRCDLIILDVDLGGDIDGFEVYRRLRELEHHRTTPVLFVSGLVSTREKLEELTGLPNDFVAKPYNLSELALKALETMLSPRILVGAEA